MSRNLKKIISVSLGSRNRNKTVTVDIHGIPFEIRRIGVDGEFRDAQQLLESFDRTQDPDLVLSLGGTDLHIETEQQRYTLKYTQRLVSRIQHTRFVDGSGFKRYVEPEMIRMAVAAGVPIAGRKTLVVCAMDRYWMARCLHELGCPLTIGDKIFALNLPDQPIYSLEELQNEASRLLPNIVKMPIGSLYPTGAKQDEAPDGKYASWLEENEVEAGDFHFMRHSLTTRLDNKTIITNTTTDTDRTLLKSLGLKWLVTTTPVIQGRTFGTNVWEGILLSLAGKKWEEMTPSDYLDWMHRIDLRPGIEQLN